MKRYKRSAERRTVRKDSEEGDGVSSEEAVAESGARVFSLRNPPEENMLTFRRRSSTRVFVPKKVIVDKEPREVKYQPRVLQSGKQLCLSEPVEKTEDIKLGELADIRWLDTNGKEESRLSEPFLPESNGNKMAMAKVQEPEKMFVNVYSRKRPRNPSWDGLDSSCSHGAGQANDPRFKIVFSRKPKHKKSEVRNDFGEVRCSQLGESEFSRARLRQVCPPFRERTSNLLDTININESELCTSFSGPLVLVVLSESSCDDNLLRLHRFLFSVISWMKRARMNLHYFAAFLFSEPIANAFLWHGIRFLPLADRNEISLLGSSMSNFGISKIYSSCELLPLISLNFLALPSFFKSLHLAALLSSRYLHFPLSTYPMASNMKLNLDTQGEDSDSHVQLESDFPGTMLSSAAMNKEAASSAQTSATLTRSTGIVRGSRLRKLQRKRSFLKHSRARRYSSMNSHSASGAGQNGAILSMRDTRVRQPEAFTGDALTLHNNTITSTPPSSHSKPSKVAKRNHGGQMKDIKAVLSDIKQNIDSVHCNASILVTACDRCWREEGAVVSLELSSSMEWCLVVKIGSDLRYLHKPQDMKFTLNRFTHAHMCIVEDGWRLEFSEKWDWLAFKELHAECRQRNNHPEDASVKVIPVPIFKEVPAYEDDRVSSFERPEQYIHMKYDDEILRASVSEASYYDMDSGDEDWLHKYNFSRATTENGTCSYISEDTFEGMIFTFEKNAYYSSSNVILSEREPDSHKELGSNDVVANVYDYWLKKRKQRHGPLVRVFQGSSLRKPPLMQRQVLRKRRSSKKQRSQVGRGKPACWFNSKAKQEAKAEALLKVKKAENAWRRSMEAAIPLRRRAQLLMENADLAAYKSVMALRIADVIRSTSANASSSFLDQLADELL